jgi:PKD repeat protein
MIQFRLSLLRFITLILLSTFVFVKANAQVTCNFIATQDSGCAPIAIVLTDASTSPNSAITSRTWTITGPIGTLPTGFSNNYAFIYSTCGDYTVSLTVTNAAGQTCTKTVTNALRIFCKPTANFTYSPKAGCPPTTVTFQNLSTAGSGTLDSLICDCRNGVVRKLTGNTPSFTCTYGNFGSYIPTCYVLNSKGCADDTTFYSDTIKIKPAPKINSIVASEINSCTTPTTIDFTGTPSTSLNISYQWYYRKQPSATWIPFGTNANLVSNSFTTGLYDIKLTVTDTTTSCSKDSVIQSFINIGNNPAPSITATKRKLCAGFTTEFTYTGSGNIANYAWTFPGGVPLTANTSTVPGVLYNNSGQYTVKVVVTFTNGCIDSLELPNYISIGNRINYSISYTDTSFCKVPDTTCLSYNGPACPGCTYTWYPSYNQYTPISSVNQPNVCYKITAFSPPNLFNLTVVDSFGCSTTKQTPGIFTSSPLNVSFATNYVSTCSPGAVSFTNTTVSGSPITGISWGFSGGTPSSSTVSPTPQISYTNPGCYRDSLIITTAAGCIGKKVDSVCFGNPVNISSISITPKSMCFEAGQVCITACGATSLDSIIFIPEAPLDTLKRFKLFDTLNTGCITFCYTYKNLGNYKPIVIASNKGCRGAPFTGGTGDTVAINGPAVNLKDSSTCSNKFRHYFKNLTMLGDSFYWEFPGGSPSVLSTRDSTLIPSVNYPQCGSYTAKLTAFNFKTGCTHFKSIPVNILCAGATLTSTDTIGCVTYVSKCTLALAPNTPTPTNIICDKDSFDGLFNNIFTGIVGINNLTYISSGNFAPCCRLTYPGGCTEVACLSPIVKVSTVRPKIFTTDTAGCAPYSTCFTDSSIAINSTLSSCTWDFSDGSPQSINCGTVCHTFNTSGNYAVKLIRTNSDGCSSIATKQIFVNTVVADFTIPDSTSCSSAIDSLHFLNTTTGLGTINYQWTTIGSTLGTNATSKDYFGKYNSTGTFPVTLIASDINNFCRDTISKNVIINNPIANYGVDQTFAACPPLLVQFTDSSLNDICEYDWDFGDGGPHSNIANPTRFYRKAGKFRVWLKVKSCNGCVDSISKDVIVIDGPYGTLSYSPLKGGCPCTDVTYHLELINTSNAVFIPGCDTTVSISNINPIGTDLNPSIYNITVRHCNIDSCQAILVLTDNTQCQVLYDDLVVPFVIDTPVLNFNYSTTGLCDSGTVCFSNLSYNTNSAVTTDSILWDFGDGTTDTTFAPCHRYTSPGTYQVSLKQKNNLGCESYLVKSLFIPRSPIAAFTENDSLGCQLQDARFWDQSVADSNTLINSWLWTFSNSVPLPLTYLSQNVSKNVGVGTFTVTLFVSDTFGCVDTAMKSLTSRVPPIANAGADKTICLGDSGTITASGGVSYQWVPNYNISSPNTASTIVWPTVDTAYLVYVSDAFNCSSLDTVNISVSNVTALFYADSVCLNNPMYFIDSSTSVHGNYASSTWNFNDPPAAGVGKYPTHTFTSDGNFNVTLTSTNSAGCKDDTTMSVAVIALPIVNFGTSSVCVGNPTLFIDSSVAGYGNITKWVWNFGDNTADSTNQNPTHIYATANTYAVRLTVYNNFGCSQSFQKSVTVYSLPQANFTLDSVCLGNISHFTNTSVQGSGIINNYLWDFNYPSSVDTLSNQSPTTFSYPTAGLHVVNLSVIDVNGCSSSISKNTQIYSLPSADFVAKNNCKGQNTLFENHSTPGDNPLTNYYWIPFNKSDTNLNEFFATPTTVNVTLIAIDAKGCRDTVTKNIAIFDKPDAGILPSDSIICENEPLALTILRLEVFLHRLPATFGICNRTML